VLYVVGEGAWGLHARVRAWEAAWRQTVPDDRFRVRRAPVNLFRPQDAAFADLLARIRAEGYGVVIFDTLQRMSTGADLNGARDAGVIIDALDQARRATGNGSVGIVGHTGKADLDTRGSSALEDDMDIVWRTKRPEGSDELTLELAKRKDGPDGAQLRLRARSVPGSGSLVLEAATGAAGPETRRPPKQALPMLQVLAGSAAVDGLSMSAIADALGLRGKGAIFPTP
jgi:hypothetical protein